MSRRANQRLEALFGIGVIVIAFIGFAKLLNVEIDVQAFFMSIKPILP